MTPKQADKLIAAGKPVLLVSCGEQVSVLITRRDRWHIYGRYVSDSSGHEFKFDRRDVAHCDGLPDRMFV